VRVTEEQYPRLTLERLLAQARALTEEQRRGFAEWDAKALRSERQLALGALLNASRDAGREAEIVRVIDDAYQAVAGSAGIEGRVSFFDDDLGDRPRESWEAAAEQAAIVAAVVVAGGLVAPEMRAFLLEPWQRLFGRAEALWPHWSRAEGQ
jgi:hypothetical protein